MSKAEKFIKDYTMGCSNEIENGVYHEWLTPDQARRAVELAREELIGRAAEWIDNNFSLCEGISGYYVAKEFKQAMKDE